MITQTRKKSSFDETLLEVSSVSWAGHRQFWEGHWPREGPGVTAGAAAAAATERGPCASPADGENACAASPQRSTSVPHRFWIVLYDHFPKTD